MAVSGYGGDAPHLDMKPRGGIKCHTVVLVKTMIFGSTMEWYRGVNVFVLNEHGDTRVLFQSPEIGRTLRD